MKMGRYQRKYDFVDAIQFDGSKDMQNVADLVNWGGLHVMLSPNPVPDTNGVMVEIQVEGRWGPQFTRVLAGDWIVRDQDNHFTVMSNVNFQTKYEEVGE